MKTTPADDLITLFDLAPEAFTVTGSEPATSSPHLLALPMAAAMGAYGATASRFGAMRGARPRSVGVQTDNALLQLMAVFATRVGSVPVTKTMEDPNLLGDSDFYKTADGREIFLLLSFPHLRDRALTVLNCPPNRSAIRKAVATWQAIDLENAIVAIGGTATMVRSREEWRVTDVGQELAQTPLVRIEATGTSEPRERPRITSDQPPLSGLRVIDLTHVIAGPVAGRLLAEAGAEVAHVSRPDRADPNAMIIETGVGKRNAYCDLRIPADRAEFHELLNSADILLHSYRGMTKFGLEAKQLAKTNPGLVFADVHGWGDRGPWSDRGGFDQLACSATGFALEEGRGCAALPPTYLLNDYVAAYLLASGVQSALTRQASEGGFWHVHIDLARVCTWIQSYGANPNQVEETSDLREQLATAPSVDRCGPFGRVQSLAPMIDIDPAWNSNTTPSAPLGSSPLEWPKPVV